MGFNHKDAKILRKEHKTLKATTGSFTTFAPS